MSEPQAIRPLDPELAAIVSHLHALQEPMLRGQELEPGPACAQRGCQAMPAFGTVQPLAVGAVKDFIADQAGSRLPVRVYWPERVNCMLPTLVLFHGGGFLQGSVDLLDDAARKLCRDVRAVVVSVGYRLAPEHRFPAAHEDALAATLWARRYIAMLGGDVRRMALVGDCAGANLAACTAMTLRHRGIRLAAQVLVAPSLDMARDVAAMEESGVDYPMLSPSDLRESARAYLGDAAQRMCGVPASPLHEADLRDLPRTLIAVAGHDPLRQEGLAYAARLEEAAVPVQLLQFEDMFHPFFGFFNASAAAMRAHDEICRTLAGWL